jgi:mevalonate kinase
MAHTPQWWTDNKKAFRKHLVPVFILNLDIAQSSHLEGQHPFRFKQTVNTLQGQIEIELKQGDFCFESWSGDGLVALYDGRHGDSEACIEKVVAIRDLFQRFKKQQKRRMPEIWGSVSLRIALVYAEVPFDDRLGRIIARDMNIAGHFQKNCPLGSVLIDRKVHDRLSDKTELKKLFERDTVVSHGNENLAAYSLHAEEPGAPCKFSDYERKILEEFRKRSYQLVVRAPASFFIIGEFASIFGYPALVLPIPLFSYVGVSERARKFVVDGLRVVDQANDCWKRHNQFHLSLPTKTIKMRPEEPENIWTNLIDSIDHDRSVKGLKLLNLSMIPTRCGLGASSAFSTALALAWHLLLGKLSDRSFNKLKIPDQTDIDVQRSEFWATYKLAWAIENYYEGGASSGGAALGSLFGSRGGFPLIYMSEKRGFDGGFPFYFADGGRQSSFKDFDFLRIRSTAHRTNYGSEHEKVALDYALLFTESRNKRTGNLIDEFFRHILKTGDTKLIDDIGRKLLKMSDFTREPILRLAKRSLNDKVLAQELPSRFTGTDEWLSGKRDLFVEWIAQTLGCISFAAQGSFLNYCSGAPESLFSFFKHINAYQEVLSSIGISGSLADLYNYRSDLFQYEIPGDEPHPFGTKLIGSGKGGDFLVMSPPGKLTELFSMLRRKLASGQTEPPCHFFSWYNNSVGLPTATVAAWRLKGDRYVAI